MKRPLSVVVAAAALGCTEPGFVTGDPTGCVPNHPDPSVTRVKEIVCSDEIADGDAERGDWLLQNGRLTVHIRSPGKALSRVRRAGATVLDIFTNDSLRVDIAEIVPLIELNDGSTDWFTAATVSPVTTDAGAGLEVTGTLPDGRTHTVTWWLPHRGAALELRGARSAEVVPLAGSFLRGDALVAGDLLHTDGLIDADDGGWFRIRGLTRFAPALSASPQQALPERYATPLAGVAPDAQQVFTRDAEGRVLQRHELSGGVFQFLADNRSTEIIATASGRASSGWQPLAAFVEDTADTGALLDIELELGDYGQIALQATDPVGIRLPVTAYWGTSRYTLTSGEGTLRTGTTERSGIITAGPAYTTAELPTTTPDEDTALAVILERVLPEDVVLADLQVNAWPDRNSRTSGSSEVGRRVARGVGWSVTSADHGVAPTGVSSVQIGDHWSSTGARVETAVGRVVSWPWSASTGAELWGAPDTTDADAHDVLALMGGGRGRFTLVDPTWLDHAGPPATWPSTPDGLLVSRLDDLPAYTALLQTGTGLSLVGPLTWLDGLDRSRSAQVDAERALLERRTIATTGPLLRLSVDGFPTGSTLPGRPLGRVAHLEVWAPTWMPVDRVELVGEGGVVESWTLGAPTDALRLEVDVVLPASGGWLLATAEGDSTVELLQDEPPWAITSAVVFSGAL